MTDDSVLQRRLQEAVEAYRDDPDGLHDEAMRIAAELGLDPDGMEIAYIDPHTDPAEAITRLYEIAADLLAETAQLRRTVDRLTVDRLTDLASAAIAITATDGTRALRRYATRLYTADRPADPDTDPGSDRRPTRPAGRSTTSPPDSDAGTPAAQPAATPARLHARPTPSHPARPRSPPHSRHPQPSSPAPTTAADAAPPTR